MSYDGAEFIRLKDFGRLASENPPCTQSLDQRHLDLRLLTHRGGEAEA
jgi:hypothetical protein